MSVFLRFLGIIFFPLLLFYTVIIYLRLKFFQWDWFQSCSVEVPVISVGNIQIGGTGKTPMVELLADIIQKNEKQAVIISRGYRRKTREPVLVEPGASESYDVESIGDEPLMLAKNKSNAAVLIDSDRCRAARKAIDQWKNSILILDDGFQHQRMKRDFDIVMIDVSRWSRLPLLFPLTSFRDVKPALGMAGCVVLMNCKKEDTKSRQLKQYLVNKYKIPVYFLHYEPHTIVNVATEEQLSIDSLKSQAIAAFCGIANPSQFFDMLEDLDLHLVWRKSYRDHHFYSEIDLSHIFSNADNTDSQYLITTQKDAVRLAGFDHNKLLRIFYLKIKLNIEPWDQFCRQVENHIIPLQP